MKQIISMCSIQKRSSQVQDCGPLGLLLAHLNLRLKCTIIVIMCYLSVVHLSITFHIFEFSSETVELKSVVDMKQLINSLKFVLSELIEKMATLTSYLLKHFLPLLSNH